jgi:hypothetical protein
MVGLGILKVILAASVDVLGWFKDSVQVGSPKEETRRSHSHMG